MSDELGLVALVERGVDPDRIALLAARPEVFPEPPGVMRDQAVCRGENGCGRAVVLLEPAQQRRAVVAAKLMQVLDPCPAPAIDRLVVVADDERITFGSDEES